MTIRHAQQCPCRAGWLSPSLLPFLQGACADAEQRRERRLTQAHAFTNRLNIIRQFHLDTPALATLYGAQARKNLLPDVSFLGHDLISFRSSRNTLSGMFSASFLA
jgi:hypothetical protein